MSWQSLEERFIQTEELYDCKTLIKKGKKMLSIGSHLKKYPIGEVFIIGQKWHRKLWSHSGSTPSRHLLYFFATTKK